MPILRPHVAQTAVLKQCVELLASVALQRFANRAQHYHALRERFAAGGKLIAQTRALHWPKELLTQAGEARRFDIGLRTIDFKGVE